MHFEWNDQKRATTLRKHGIDFVHTSMIFDGWTKTMPDEDRHLGEERLLTFGLLESRVVVVAHTETNDLIRVISIRKATNREQAFHFQDFPH